MTNKTLELLSLALPFAALAIAFFFTRLPVKDDERAITGRDEAEYQAAAIRTKNEQQKAEPGRYSTPALTGARLERAGGNDEKNP
jgi:hypothetical protein